MYAMHLGWPLLNRTFATVDITLSQRVADTLSPRLFVGWRRRRTELLGEKLKSGTFPNLRTCIQSSEVTLSVMRVRSRNGLAGVRELGYKREFATISSGL